MPTPKVPTALHDFVIVLRSNRTNEGVVQSIGPNVYSVKPGDTVFFSCSGVQKKFNDDDYYVVREKDIYAKMDWVN